MEASRKEQDLKAEVKVSEESTLDWRGKPSNPQKHGGMRAAAFLLGSFSFSQLLIFNIVRDDDDRYNDVQGFKDLR